ncbi:MAG TPA: protein kinase [Pyrinomonadaceae bacterium]|nr:protein kinase [Pyrinomonadaceae bacterium]
MSNDDELGFTAVLSFIDEGTCSINALLAKYLNGGFAMNCPSCRQVLLEDARFCSHCGLSTNPIQGETADVSKQETLKYEHAHLFIGRVLDSKYKLLERLGEGGMGTVYRARRLHIGDEVAVKLLHADLVVEAEAVERFRREARSAAMISHANVVSIYDFSDAQTPGSPAYIVMELVRGASLRQLLRSGGRLSPERAVHLMRDICAGVGVAHRQGLVHRDLKPDNVIIAPASHDGEPDTAKVVDFGIAKLRDLAAESGLTQPGVVVGTIFYMSPEQCRGEELDARGDVYSLGAMLYEMLTGEPPFQANNLVGLISKHLMEAPPCFPVELKIPSRLAATCFRALAKNRDERHADALELRRELQSALAPQNEAGSVAAAPVSKSSYGWIKWAVAGIGVLLLFLIVVGAGALYFYSARQPAPATDDANTTNNRPDDARQAGEQQNNDGVSAAASVSDLRGVWTGTFGPLGLPGTLTIKSHSDRGFDGTLEQGGVTVAFKGTLDAPTREITMKETEVLSGGSWSLGENVGKLSADGKSMSGTGKDAIGGQFGISYSWSFSRN